MTKIRWGIIGCGKIAHHFTKDLALVSGGALFGVASRSLDKAQAFANQYTEPIHCYGDYQALINDPNVDVIYIATPHNSHLEWAMKSLLAGKHVLCEKPLTVNHRQTSELIRCAQTQNVFLMEALWTRFVPSFIKALDLIGAGAIGSPNYISADFSFKIDGSPESRLYNMDLAGGSILDVLIYPVFLTYMVMGMPEQITALANFYKTGVDIQASAILKYAHGIANINSGFRSTSDMVAKIYGTDGAIHIEPRWHESEKLTLVKDGAKKPFDLPKTGKGYVHEISEVHNCIRAGKLQSDLWSHQDSLNLISILDEIRAKVNLKYPFES